MPNASWSPVERTMVRALARFGRKFGPEVPAIPPLYADLWGRAALQQHDEFDRKILFKSFPADLTPFVKFPTASIDVRGFLNARVRAQDISTDLFAIYQFLLAHERIANSSFSSFSEGVHVTLTAARVAGGPPYTFMYRGKIKNERDTPVRLLGRHYDFRNAQGKVETQIAKNSVAACGVVGHTPLIAPGQSFVFYSGVTLSTRTGGWKGKLEFCEDAEDFEVEEIKNLPLVQRYAVLAERGVNKFEVSLPTVSFHGALAEVLDPVDCFILRCRK